MTEQRNGTNLDPIGIIQLAWQSWNAYLQAGWYVRKNSLLYYQFTVSWLSFHQSSLEKLSHVPKMTYTGVCNVKNHKQSLMSIKRKTDK